MNYNDFCKSKECEHYIEWECGLSTGEQPYPCVSCKLVGQSLNIEQIPEDCPFIDEIALEARGAWRMDDMSGTYSGLSYPENPLTYDLLMEAMVKMKMLQPAPPPIRVIKSLFLTVSYFERTFIPRSKKRRIVRKSWKRYSVEAGNEPDPSVYFMGDKMVGHPETIRAITELIPEAREGWRNAIT